MVSEANNTRLILLASSCTVWTRAGAGIGGWGPAFSPPQALGELGQTRSERNFVDQVR